jgi:hypothetical protein
MATGKLATVSALRASMSSAQPPAALSVPVMALWWEAKGDWSKAHALVQGVGGGEAAWVHAHLHRVEGDPSNAAYWYRRAGRDPSNSSIEAEWSEIAADLLDEDNLLRLHS